MLPCRKKSHIESFTDLSDLDTSAKSLHSILVTGGTGYIGSHTVLELLKKNLDVVVFDNLSNSSEGSVWINLIEKLCGKKVNFVKGDLLSICDLTAVFSSYQISHVIHFAGLKAVGESVRVPLSYYENNVTGTLNLLKVMSAFKCNNIIYSSSATVYGNPKIIPIPENCPTSPTSPYGQSKLIVETMLQDLCNASPLNATILRYFNPVGAHESGIMGEDPSGVPNNLTPFISQVAIGKLKELTVFGNDYETIDGTGVRDYIHVCDLADGHLAALEQQIRTQQNHTQQNQTQEGQQNQTPQVGQCRIYNLGSGIGYSVLQVIKAMEKATSLTIPYKATLLY